MIPLQAPAQRGPWGQDFPHSTTAMSPAIVRLKNIYFMLNGEITIYIDVCVFFSLQ